MNREAVDISLDVVVFFPHPLFAGECPSQRECCFLVNRYWDKLHRPSPMSLTYGGAIIRAEVLSDRTNFRELRYETVRKVPKVRENAASQVAEAALFGPFWPW